MTDTIRSFAAISLPENLKSKLEQYLLELKQIAPKVKWVRSESIHITLKFLGEQKSDLVDKVSMRLMDVPDSFSGISLSTGHFGAFPGEKRPRVFWLGINSTQMEKLLQLQRWVENELQVLGFEKEKRRFSPHLTLGRVKHPDDFSRLWKYAEENPFPELSFNVEEFYLMRSILKPTGAVYRPLQKYSLQG